MQISSLAQVLRLRENVSDMQSQLGDLNRQLVTGKKADTFGGLGADRNLVLSMRQEIGSIESYLKTITQTELRMTAMSDVLTRIDTIMADVKAGSLTTGFDLVNGGQTDLQVLAGLQLDEVVALLNLEVEDRHLFAGRDTLTKPVVSADLILNGDTTHAGLIQLIDERRQADLGVDNRGRLAIPVPAGAAVSLAETDDPNAFGFKLGAIASTLAGTAIVQPAGSPPTASVTFGAPLPGQGETIAIDLLLPDGSTETITLTAETIGPAGEGEFLVGVDANTTAANFQAALDTAIQTKAKTALRAASATVATDNFFDTTSSTPPQRVNGPPFGTATTLIDGTTADTIFWYQGDNTTTPISDSAVAKIDDGRTLSYGSRADDDPIRTALKVTALLAAESYTGLDPDEDEAYDEMIGRLIPLAGFKGVRSVGDVVIDLGLKADKLDETKTRHERALSLSKGLVEDKENADAFEIGAKLGQLQTQLQASFQVTARLNELSLINFIR